MHHRLLAARLLLASCVALSACSSSSSGPATEENGEDDVGFGIGGPPIGGGTPDSGAGSPGALDSETSTADGWGNRAHADAATMDGDHVGMGDPPDEECGYGTLLGLVCSPNEQIFVNGAHVWIDTLDCDGNPLLLETYSNADGAYGFLDSVPSGYQTVHIQAGDWHTTQLSFIKGGKISDVSGVAFKQCYQVTKACEYGAVRGSTCIGEGEALPGAASVWAEGKDCNQQSVVVQATPDELGVYVLEGVPTGVVQVFVQWGGKLVQYPAVVQPGQTTQLSALTDPICFPDNGCESGAVSGSVCRADGLAWQAGATVSVDALDCNAEIQHFETSTNANGEFWLAGIPPGPHWVVVKVGSDGFQVPANVPAGGVDPLGLLGSAQCNPDSCQYGKVVGSICPGAGSPGAASPGLGATVYTSSVNCNGQLVTVEATADATGAFQLVDVPVGTTWVFAEFAGSILQAQVQVASGQTSTVAPMGGAACSPDGGCALGGVSGLVCKPTGNGWVNGASITINSLDCEGAPAVFQASTNSSGAFNVQGIPAGPKWLVVQHGAVGYQIPVTVPANSTAQLGVLGAATCDPNPCSFGHIQGSVCTLGGKPIGGSAKVWVSAPDCKGAMKNVEVTTGPGGSYVLPNVPTGTVWVFVQWEGLINQYQVNVQAGQTAVVPTTQAGVCFPEPTCGVGAITGRVCMPNGSNWATGASVSLQSKDCNGKNISASANTGADGSFWLTSISEGTHWVVVQPQGGQGFQEQVTVYPSSTTDMGVLGSKSCNPGGQCGFGSVSGYVCAPSGVKVPGGTVLVQGVDCQGNPSTLQAAVSSTGDFSVGGVPAGVVTVTVTKGDWSTTYSVTVAPGQNTYAPSVVSSFCFPDKQVKLAVVGGNWDAIELILAQLGLSYDFFDSNSGAAGTLLSDIGLMGQYDVIFFNCGGAHSGLLSGIPSIPNNVKMYVQGGGSIYASDWAYLYAELPWPNAIDFAGNDAGGSDPKIGPAQAMTAGIVDPVLSGYLGKSNVSLQFNLSQWVVMTSAAASTKTHVQGWVAAAGAQVPLLVSHSPGGGGKVFFTSFHNEPQVSSDMKKILHFLVFEL